MTALIFNTYGEITDWVASHLDTITRSSNPIKKIEELAEGISFEALDAKTREAKGVDYQGAQEESKKLLNRARALLEKDQEIPLSAKARGYLLALFDAVLNAFESILNAFGIASLFRRQKMSFTHSLKRSIL